ncbi:MAG: DUF4364 family protein [Oscillospiraceae bacterium]|nr:DUF4364 family protein [Oscillospiraceae bacterium]
MELNALTAGVEPGGLTHGYEIKILVCYLLDQIKEAMTFEQIHEALLAKGLVNYFELADALSELLESGHIRTVDCIKDSDAYQLTPLGLETSHTFQSSLPTTVRDKAVRSARNLLARKKRETENLVSITRAMDGYIVDMTICDIGSDLLSLSLFMPTEEEAQQVRRRFLRDPLLVYKGVLALMTGDLKTVGELSETPDNIYEDS